MNSFPTLPTDTVDLHCHSTASDGTFRPADVVRLAHEAGVTGIALTDHDTINGLAEAGAEAARVGLDFLPGMEVSAAFPRPGTMHLLAYGFDPETDAFRALAESLAAARAERAGLIVARLNQLGLGVSLAEVFEEAGSANVGRPHIASVLIRRGHAASSREAFDRYLGGGGAAHVDNAPFDAPAVIALIRRAGGMVSLAHPLQLRRANFEQLEALIRELAEQGMEGLETIHSTHSEETRHRLTRLADRLDLLTTGGSDFHGANKPWIRLGEAGGQTIPRIFFDNVSNRLEGRRRLPLAESRRKTA